MESAARAIKAAEIRAAADSRPAEEEAQQPEEEEEEWPALPSSDWTRDDSVPVILDTFMAAVEWLEAAPPPER